MVAIAIELRTAMLNFSPRALQAAVLNEEKRRIAREATASSGAGAAAAADGIGVSPAVAPSMSGAIDSKHEPNIMTRRQPSKRLSLIGNGFINAKLWAEAEKIADKFYGSTSGLSAAVATDLKIPDGELKAVKREVAFQRTVTDVVTALEKATAANDADALHTHTEAATRLGLRPQYYPSVVRANECVKQLALLREDVRAMKEHAVAKRLKEAAALARTIVEVAAKLNLDSADVRFAKKLQADIVRERDHSAHCNCLCHCCNALHDWRFSSLPLFSLRFPLLAGQSDCRCRPCDCDVG
jgi:hypothetical protein